MNYGIYSNQYHQFPLRINSIGTTPSIILIFKQFFLPRTSIFEVTTLTSPKWRGNSLLRMWPRSPEHCRSQKLNWQHPWLSPSTEIALWSPQATKPSATANPFQKEKHIHVIHEWTKQMSVFDITPLWLQRQRLIVAVFNGLLCSVTKLDILGTYEPCEHSCIRILIMQCLWVFGAKWL